MIKEEEKRVVVWMTTDEVEPQSSIKEKSKIKMREILDSDSRVRSKSLVGYLRI